MAACLPVLTQESHASIAVHTKDDCRKMERKKELERNDGQTSKKRVPQVPHLSQNKPLGRTELERRRSPLQTKNLNLDYCNTKDTSPTQTDANRKPTPSILKKSKKTRAATTSDKCETTSKTKYFILPANCA